MPRKKSHRIAQLTVRGFDEELAACLEQVALEEDISLNQAALRLLRKGAGLDRRPARDVIGTALDELIGSWTEEDARELRESLADMETIDPELWR